MERKPVVRRRPKNRICATGSIMEIWESGAKIPFLAKDINSDKVILVMEYFWPSRLFFVELDGVNISIDADLSIWEFIREM